MVNVADLRTLLRRVDGPMSAEIVAGDLAADGLLDIHDVVRLPSNAGS